MGGSGSTATCHCRGQAARGAGGACRDYNEEVGKRSTAGAGNRGERRTARG